MLGIMLRGMAVGVTEAVPGISGSTVAMILGVYERFIYSLSMLTTRKRRKSLPFLLLFGSGMVIGFIIAIFLVGYLLKTFRAPTLLFFVGIIVGFLPYLWKDTLKISKKRLKVKHYVIIFLSIGIVVISQLLGHTSNMNLTNLSLANYFLLGMIGLAASTALLLPGISGALILTIFGVYEFAMESLIMRNLPVVFAIGTGVLIGVLFSSKFIRYLLLHYQLETYCAMIGLVSGSIFAILYNLDTYFNTQTIIISIISFLAGVISLVVLEKMQDQN